MASILPPHLSELERDLDAAMARLAAIDIPISTLWNPHTCPVEVLPYLAWANSTGQQRWQCVTSKIFSIRRMMFRGSN